MDPRDKLLNRITDRLSVDRELQMEVAAELRCHIEDKAAELRQSGLDEAEAVEQACKALGEPDALAEQLWQANRMRIGIRGACRWAARIALVPAAIIVVFAIARGLAGENWGYGVVPAREFPATRTFKSLPEEQRYILAGDPKATSPLARAKSISDRWPDNPVYYGQYVTYEMNVQHRRLEDLSPDTTEAELAGILALLEKGKRIDPNNAFYNFAEAGLLVQCAGQVREDPGRTYLQVDSGGQEKSKGCYQFELASSDRFDRALAELRRGLAKDEFSCRSVEVTDLRVAILGAPRRFSDYMRRLQWRFGFILPHLNRYRHLAKALCGRAIALAEQGAQDQALELVDAAKGLGAKLGARGTTLIELLVAQAIQTTALAHEQQVYIELGRQEQADGALAELEQQTDLHNRALNAPGWFGEDQYRQAGLFWSALLPSFADPMDFEPMRSAEQALFLQTGLLCLLGILVLLTLLRAAEAALDLIVHRGDPAAKGLLLFVGWRRIGRICLLAIVLPLAAYVVYSYGLVRGDQQYGLNYTAGKVVAEMALTAAAVLALLHAMSYSAVRARAEEIGLAVPAPIRLRNRPLVAALGALSILPSLVYLVGWQLGYFRPSGYKPSFDAVYVPGLALAAVLLAFLLVWRLRECVGLRFGKGELAQFRRTLRRSMIPILAAGVILVGVVCGWSLANMETSAISRVKGQADWSWRDEVRRSSFRPLKDHFAHMEQARQARLASSSDAGL